MSSAPAPDEHDVETDRIQDASPWSPGLDDQDRAILKAIDADPNRIVEWALTPVKRLGYFDTAFIILNRCIGTGVFNSAWVINSCTQSLGISILIWVFGCIVALAGTHIYVDFGLTIPRWTWKGEEKSVPRSGGELPYLNYVFKSPKFLTTCIFGVGFILIGNTAANSVQFGQNVQIAAGRVPSVGGICGIGIGATAVACCLHTMSRRWGIRMNNIFGFSKFLILIFLIIVGFSAAAKGPIAEDGTLLHSPSNLDPSRAFSNEHRSSRPFRYAEAFLFVLFPFGGFHQGNYVLAEIDQPRKKFRRVAFTVMTIVCILFLLVNLAFMVVVPEQDQLDGTVDIGQRFFEISMRTLAGTSSDQSERAFAGLRTISSMGNIIVMTYTASRVKQEIAKEGILPFSLFFAKSYDLSLSRLRRMLSSSPRVASHTEPTPVAALFLHLFFTSLLVVIPTVILRKQRPGIQSYIFIVTLYTFVLDVVFFVLIGIAMLYLRLAQRSKYRSKSESNHWISIIASLIFFGATLFPLICLWIPDPAEKTLTALTTIPWFVAQTVCAAVFGISLLYWFGFRFIVPRIGKHHGMEFVIERIPRFHEEHGYPVQTFEEIAADWKLPNASNPDKTLIELSRHFNQDIDD